MNKEKYEKAEFKVPKQWKLIYNKLLNLDLDKVERTNDKIWSQLSEDIVNIVNYKSNTMVDVGWYPEFSQDGHYGLVVVENNEWQKPIETFVTRNTNKLIEKIVMILDKY